MTPTRAGAGRPKSREKRFAILGSAAALFLKQGVEDTTMGDVAKEAGVSKQTVYSHFGSKEALYEAVIAYKLELYGLDSQLVDEHSHVPDALRAVARQFLDLSSDPEVVAMFRILIAESARNPETVDLFWRSGPQKTQRALAHRLGYWASRGILSMDDPDTETCLFFGALQGDHHMEQLMNRTVEWDEARRDRLADLVVTRFLKAWDYNPDRE
ncbi:TetR/AcrR family transcriptional regulator [Marinobacteraceae bacterium S3BR75-40.1]